MSIVSNVVIGLIVAIVLIAIAVKLLAWLYLKSSGETAFVRTGFMGRRVVLNGGAFVIPVLHQTVPVNLSTLRLEVVRAKESSLITRDHMRVDVHVAFYVRVIQEKDAIALAAQTLGARTMNPQALAELVEGKFVDVLRAAAAQMTMHEMHETRAVFVANVKKSIAEDLTKNGLELESVSLLDLDQTSLQYFDAKNAFDAEGLTRITEEIEKKRKRRADIAQDTELAIRRKELEVEHQQLAIDKEHLSIAQEAEFARLAQEEAVAVRRAEQGAVIAREQAERKRRADEAGIDARLQTGQAETAARQDLEVRQIESELAVAAARLDLDRRMKELEAEKTRLVEIARIETGRSVEIAEAGRAIDLARAEIGVAEARTLTQAARLAELKAQEGVATERAREHKLREKLVAEFAAEFVRIAAAGEADADRIRSEAAMRVAEIEAEARRLLNEAENTLSADQVALRVKLASLERLPDIIRESVRPMERIESIRIAHVDGLGRTGGGDGAAGGQPEPQRNLAEQVVDSALRYRAQAPLVDDLLRTVGIDGMAAAAGLRTGLVANGHAPPQRLDAPPAGL